MTKKPNPNEAPKGCKAVLADPEEPCEGCTFNDCCGGCLAYDMTGRDPLCDSENRKDGRDVIFVPDDEDDEEVLLIPPRYGLSEDYWSTVPRDVYGTADDGAVSVDHAALADLGYTVTGRETQGPAEHYEAMAIEPWDCIEAWWHDFPGNPTTVYYLGCALKYMARAGKKQGNPIGQELAKALDFLQQAFENEDE